MSWKPTVMDVACDRAVGLFVKVGLELHEGFDQVDELHVDIEKGQCELLDEVVG